jgi:hypothetical protein
MGRQLFVDIHELPQAYQTHSFQLKHKHLNKNKNKIIIEEQLLEWGIMFTTLCGSQCAKRLGYHHRY